MKGFGLSVQGLGAAFTVKSLKYSMRSASTTLR